MILLLKNKQTVRTMIFVIWSLNRVVFCETDQVGSFLRTSAKRVDSQALSRIADKAFEAAAAGDDDPLAEVSRISQC